MPNQNKELKATIRNLSRNVRELRSISKELEITQPSNPSNQRNIKNVKDNIIGKLPRILLSSEYFENNADIFNFAEKYLEIKIPNREKKSRADLIGHIVVQVEKLNAKKLTKFNTILNIITEKSVKKEDESFFLKWEKAIRQIELK